MNRYRRCSGIALAILCTLLAVGSTTPAQAAGSSPTPLSVSGWIPYWRAARGIADVTPHLNQLTEVNPFGYTVKRDGSLYDALDVGSTTWQTFFAAARTHRVSIVPTVMWSDGNQIDTVLRSTSLRKSHVSAIVAMVRQNDFDGVDIDYEGKLAETNPYFSKFLTELKTALGKKQLDCTVEARTPISSRYLGTPPPDATTYANDFAVLNRYCDHVRLMTYDQQSVDQALSRAAAQSKQLYAPVADPVWVRKVITLAAQSISKTKLSIGIATYGYGYDVIATPAGYTYDLLWSFNPGYALPIAKSLGITPSQNATGEISFAYMPTSTPASLVRAVTRTTVPAGGYYVGNAVAAKALAYANSSGKNVPFRLMWWSGAQAIADKIALAREMGIEGVAFFKFDDGEDQAFWDSLPVRTK